MSYTDAFYALLERVLPEWKDAFFAVEIPDDRGRNRYEVEGLHGKVVIKGDCAVSLAMGLYDYLKRVMRANISWCGNRTFDIGEPKIDFVPFKKTVAQKYRVYMNYCTLCYTMAFWDFQEWEREIDFMAMRGINMPLAVVGSEYAMYETLLKYNYTEEESLRTVSSPAFQAWQWMTNLDSYVPVPSVAYLKLRLKLGKKIMTRYKELGMFPIQQGFSGHVPATFAAKNPKAKVSLKSAWCGFPKTAQLDPLDPLFQKIGRDYLEIQKKSFGAHGFYACDPFHEGSPPRSDYFYLRNVGKAIDKLYRDFDADSVWVMQSWSIRKWIARAVPKSRLLILDLDGARCKKTRNFWGYDFVSGHLHNFGGKNSLHGDLQQLAENKYYKLAGSGAHAVGTGLFPEGVEQNPVYYDLLFDILTEDAPLDLEKWLDDYVLRRYGKEDANARATWKILLQSVYAPHTGAEEESGSVVTARPSPMPRQAAPNDRIAIRYDNRDLFRAIARLLEGADNLKDSDGYRFDIMDFARQAVSNEIESTQRLLPDLIEKRDLAAIRTLRDIQLSAMRELDGIAATRSETTLARWLGFARRFGGTEAERAYSERSARLLITIWGDENADPALDDYAWREYSGLISDYYVPRWELFYDALLKTLEENKSWDEGKLYMFSRVGLLSTEFGKKLYAQQKAFVNASGGFAETKDVDPIPVVKEMMAKREK